MSKTAKSKSRQPSLHSRAARRATSPSLEGNTDRSLKTISPPSTSKTSHIFAGARNASIKKKKNKQLTRGQLERQRKGVERADIVKEQLGVKVAKSLDRLKNVKERRKDWDVLNGETGSGGAVQAVKGGKFGALDMDVGDEEGGNEAGGEEKSVESGVAVQDEIKLELPVRTAESENVPPAAEEALDVVDEVS